MKNIKINSFDNIKSTPSGIYKYRDCLIDLFGDMIRVNKCHLTFIPKVNLNNIHWRVRNCMQRIRVAATVPEV